MGGYHYVMLVIPHPFSFSLALKCRVLKGHLFLPYINGVSNTSLQSLKLQLESNGLLRRCVKRFFLNSLE